MINVVVSDTSCLIALEKINQIEILAHLYQQVVVTPIVAREYGKPLPNWVSVQPAINHALQQHLEKNLDIGEASSIALACDTPGSLLLLTSERADKSQHSSS